MIITTCDTQKGHHRGPHQLFLARSAIDHRLTMAQSPVKLDAAQYVELSFSTVGLSSQFEWCCLPSGHGGSVALTAGRRLPRARASRRDYHATAPNNSGAHAHWCACLVAFSTDGALAPSFPLFCLLFLVAGGFLRI